MYCYKNVYICIERVKHLIPCGPFRCANHVLLSCLYEPVRKEVNDVFKKCRSQKRLTYTDGKNQKFAYIKFEIIFIIKYEYMFWKRLLIISKCHWNWYVVPLWDILEYSEVCFYYCGHRLRLYIWHCSNSSGPVASLLRAEYQAATAYSSTLL